MNETYTLQQVMDRLGIRSANTIFHLERKYPHAFVVMKRGPRRDMRYHKATLDRFAERREYSKQMRP